MTDSTSASDYPQAARRRSSRRTFLRTAGGVAAGTALFVAGCDGDSIPSESELTAGGISVDPASLEDNAQDDLTVTFVIGEGDGSGSFPSRVSDARIEISNGDVITDGVAPGASIDYSFDQRGEYEATLVTEGDFTGTATASTGTFVVGAMAVTIDFSTDAGVLNYAYALEQLEAAFYAQVNASVDSGDLSLSGDAEVSYFQDLAAHEAIHRDFLAAALGQAAIPSLVPNFSSVDFSSRDSVLGTAQTLEDVGVSAYNGAADLLSYSQNLLLAGKIVSVEARHASAIRSIIGDDTNFADLSDDFLQTLGAQEGPAYDVALDPGGVLEQAGGFITTPLNPVGL